MEDLTGQTLGQYEIVARIGEGGMATVYRARQARLNREVAVKVMSPELAANHVFRERFELEAQASANFRHPNILTVHDYGETDSGLLYLVVEYVQAGTLRQRLEQPMPLGEAVEIVAQVAEALDYAHRQGVVHRDVKPNNILLRQDGLPLLTDFGLVKPVQGDRSLTATGMILGTPDYMAPEQARGLTLDGRTDVYALGVMLFEVLTGRHPFTGETPVSIVIKHATEPLPRPSQIKSGVPSALDEIVAKATAKDPDDRYQRAGEMARALRTALVSGKTPDLGGEQVILPPPIAPPPAPVSPIATPMVEALPSPAETWYRQRKVWAVGAVAVIVVLLGALLLLLRTPPPAEEQKDLVGAVPTVEPGTTLVLVARFKAQEGSAHYDVSQRINDALTNDFGRYGQTDVVVYQVPQVIEASSEAIELGRQAGATLVIWGFYDDIGISPNIQTLGTTEESALSVGLERLDTGDSAEFRRYIAKDLPEELSFLTALSLVQIYMLQGDLTKTIFFLGMASENLPADPQFRSSGEMVDFIQGTMAFFAGDLEGAVQQMDRAIASDSNKTLFYTMRAFAHVQLAQVDEALADLDKAVALEPNNEMAYVLQGAVAWMMGDLEAAMGAYDRLIELEPDVVELYLVRSMIAFENGNLESARDTFDQVERNFQESGYISLARGLVYEKMGQGTQAAADYARAVELAVSPDQGIQLVSGVTGEIVPPFAYLFQCTAYQARGDFEAALNSCARALEADPLNPDAHWKRGQLYAAQGDWETALADYTAALEIDPRWPWVYYLRAQMLIELGREDEAQADLVRALELKPADELRKKIEDLRASSS